MIWLMLSCTPETDSIVARCALDLSLDPGVAAPGESVVASGGPQTEPYDTIARVGGLEAVVTSVQRDDCEICDSCRVDAECLVCTPCIPCLEQCAACAESVTFVVPEAATPGSTAVVIWNGSGTSPSLPFTVSAPADTDTDDSDTDP